MRYRYPHFFCLLFLQDLSSGHLQDMSLERHHVFKTSSRHVFKTSSRRLARCLQVVFARRLQEVFKTSWKTKDLYAEDVLKTSSRPTNVCWVVYHSSIVNPPIMVQTTKMEQNLRDYMETHEFLENR